MLTATPIEMFYVDRYWIGPARESKTLWQGQYTVSLLAYFVHLYMCNLQWIFNCMEKTTCLGFKVFKQMQNLQSSFRVGFFTVQYYLWCYYCTDLKRKHVYWYILFSCVQRIFLEMFKYDVSSHRKVRCVVTSELKSAQCSPAVIGRGAHYVCVLLPPNVVF